MEQGTARFFAFINERETVRLRKEADRIASENFEEPQGPPWTDDPILQKWKFTNVFRHHDRTSMMLREKLYGPNFHEDRASILMNCAIARYFGTWEFSLAVGWQSYEGFDFEGLKRIATERLLRRERVFTGAYVITNQGISAPKQEVVVDIFLKGLHENTPAIVAHANISQSWREVAAAMAPLLGFGGTGFMTKEVLLDTTYTGFWNIKIEHPEDGSFSIPSDWWQWTPIGPGGLRGAARVSGDNSGGAINKKQALDVIKHLYSQQTVFWKHGGKLAPTDIQFQLCEFDKYERVRLGQGTPRSLYPGTR